MKLIELGSAKEQTHGVFVTGLFDPGGGYKRIQ
jgi:hypothetical protein